jgi:hypothetical protein
MERPREQPARPDGRHPARTRRKRKRRRALEPKPMWMQPTHWNPLTLLGTLGMHCLFTGAMFLPLMVPALRILPDWLIATLLFSLLAAVLTAPFHTTLFLHWRVSSYCIHALQPGRGGAITRSFTNQNIASVNTFGPFAIIRNSSGKRLLWPRWLVLERVIHRWQLDGGKLTLQPRAAQLGPGRTKQE